MSLKELVIIGGGAAGFFAALAAKEANPAARVTLLEKTAVLLSKVKISGGGRCNVTHGCFDPKELVKNYPRGEKELLGPFHRFQPKDTVAWFEERGVRLKTEADGRIFPISDSSQTIIDCLVDQAQALGVEILLKQRVQEIVRREFFEITLQDGERLLTPKLLLATGSSREGYEWAQRFGHTIQSPVPSLFTFNVPDSPLSHLSGISWNPVKVSLPAAMLSQTGPLLITHFGFSGPAVLKLSAWAARFLHECHYQSELSIDWFPDFNEEALFQELRSCRGRSLRSNPFHLPKNLWISLLEDEGDQMWLSWSDKELRALAAKLHRNTYLISGKTTHKEEFVTCGGVTLQEIDFKTMQSKICPGLYFAGEILDIDGVTGGFNFQNGWTTGYLSGLSACS